LSNSTQKKIGRRIVGMDSEQFDSVKNNKKYICENCKTEVSDNQKFCTNCGSQLQLMDVEKMKLRELTKPFDVLDALGGDISGDYKKDIKKMNKRGFTCTKQVYMEAYKMSEMP